MRSLKTDLYNMKQREPLSLATKEVLNDIKDNIKRTKIPEIDTILKENISEILTLNTELTDVLTELQLYLVITPEKEVGFVLLIDETKTPVISLYYDPNLDDMVLEGNDLFLEPKSLLAILQNIRIYTL